MEITILIISISSNFFIALIPHIKDYCLKKMEHEHKKKELLLEHRVDLMMEGYSLIYQFANEIYSELFELEDYPDKNTYISIIKKYESSLSKYYVYMKSDIRKLISEIQEFYYVLQKPDLLNEAYKPFNPSADKSINDELNEIQKKGNKLMIQINEELTKIEN